MKNRELYGEKIHSTLGTSGICKVMNDMVFPFYREKNNCAVACDDDCATCSAMFAMWLGEKAKCQEETIVTLGQQTTGLSTLVSPMSQTKVEDHTNKQLVAYDYIDDLGRPIIIDGEDKMNALTGEIYEDSERTPVPRPGEFASELEFDDEEELKDAPTVNFHRQAFETGEVGIRCENYEDAVSVCHILKNMGYKGEDLNTPEQCTPGSFYIYNRHDKLVFLFESCFIPYLEGSVGKPIEEQFCILDYDEINFLPEQKTEEKVELSPAELNIEEILKALSMPLVSIAVSKK